MQWLSPVLLAIQVISSLSIILLVLLQQGKGADMGSSFGGGSAGSLFGASGAANFLSRATKWAAIIFFASTGALAYLAHHPTSSVLEGGIMQGFKAEPVVPAGPPPGAEVPSVPAAPGAGDAAPSGEKPESSPGSVPSAGVPQAPAPAADASVPPAPSAAEPSARPDAPAPAGQEQHAPDSAPAEHK